MGLPLPIHSCRSGILAALLLLVLVIRSWYRIYLYLLHRRSRSRLKGLLLAVAFRAEIAGNYCTTGTFPLISDRLSLWGTRLLTWCLLHLWLCGCLLLSHGIECLGVESTCHICHIHTHKACHSAGRVASCCFHGICLCTC